MVFSLTGGVSFCSGVGRARGSYGEPKVTPPSLVYTPSDLTSIGTFPGPVDLFDWLGTSFSYFVNVDSDFTGNQGGITH